jgi:hypothetical protein
MTQVVIAVLGIISALLLAKLQSLLSENAKLREDVNSQKHKIYVELTDLLQSLMDGKSVDDPAKRMKDINNKIVFFASAKVLKAVGDFMQHLYRVRKISFSSDEKEEDENFKTLKLYAELMSAIREDLGVDKVWSRVSWADIIRPTITDLNEYTPRRFARNRKRRTLPYARLRKHHKVNKKAQAKE